MSNRKRLSSNHLNTRDEENAVHFVEIEDQDEKKKVESSHYFIFVFAVVLLIFFLHSVFVKMMHSQASSPMTIVDANPFIDPALAENVLGIHPAISFEKVSGSKIDIGLDSESPKKSLELLKIDRIQNNPVDESKENVVENSVVEDKKSEEDLQSLEMIAHTQIEEIREMKKNGVIIENDALAQDRIKIAQETIRKLLRLKYGPEPYQVDMELKFPLSLSTDMQHPENEIFVLTMELGSAE